jgi:hypothetical protein
MKSPSPRRWVALAVSLVVLALAGCGGSESPGEKREHAAQIELQHERATWKSAEEWAHHYMSDLAPLQSPEQRRGQEEKLALSHYNTQRAREGKPGLETAPINGEIRREVWAPGEY